MVRSEMSAQRLGVADFLEVVEGDREDLVRPWPMVGQFFRLEQLAEPLPAHAGRFLIPAVVQVALKIHAGLLGERFVGGLGRLALALAGVRVDPLEDQG